MDAVIARKMWRTLEPFHGFVYFAPEAVEAYDAVGIDGRRAGYFASRSAPMGAVPAEVVVATFFNFNPAVVRRAVPGAWAQASPEAVVAARFSAVGAGLRRLVGDIDADEPLELARQAAEACTPEGRPLYAGHASVPWPGEPLLDLWNAVTLVREFRGDGHIAVLTAEGLSAVEALVAHAAMGAVPAEVLQRTRGWDDEAWATGEESLRSRGWLDKDSAFTDKGREARDAIETRTDELAMAPWRALGEERSDRLRSLIRPMSKTIADSGAFAVPPTTFLDD